MSLDNDSSAAKRLYAAVRVFSARARNWQVVIRHDVTPDEQRDPTLISRRVYGRPDEYLVVMASAGIDSVDQEIPQTQLVLPTEPQLYKIKRDTGFESIAEYRQNGAPTWAK